MTLRTLVLALALLGASRAPGRLAAQEPAAEAPSPDTVVFTPQRGKVTFTHKKHAELAECTSCHHESKPEKPLLTKHQACDACHTNPATEPVKTSLRMAYHNTAERTGICYDCHVKEAAQGKTLPIQCNDCHKRETAEEAAPQ